MVQQLRVMASALLGLLFLLDTTEAWPSSFSCDYACMALHQPGGSFGNMQIANFGPAPTGANCQITTDIPAGGYAVGGSYSITITSTTALARRIASDVAGFAGKSIKTVGTGATTSIESWTATSASSATFHALCGAGGNIDQMWVASPVTFNIDASATAPPTTTVTTTTATLGPVGSGPTVELIPGVTLRSTISGNNVEISVVSDRNAWAAVGFSASSTVSMTGEGKGVDLFACVNGAVKRYWVTTKTAPSGGTSVTGSSCAYINGKMHMTFSRTLAAQANTVAVTQEACQVINVARGGSGSTSSFTFHATADRDGKNVNLQDVSKACADAPGKSVPAALWLHLLAMLFAWSFLVPWGVTLANRTRAAPGGAWFKLHKIFNYTGWCAQLIGFAMGVWHAEANAGGHFGSYEVESTSVHTHTYTGLVIVILATQQPLNAFLRPHASPGHAKSTARWIFEIVHKSSGYSAVLLGVFNCFLGISLLDSKGYDSTATVVAIVLSALGLLPVVGFWILSFFKQDNLVANMCVGLVGSSMHAVVDSEHGKQGDAIGNGQDKE